MKTLCLFALSLTLYGCSSLSSANAEPQNASEPVMVSNQFGEMTVTILGSGTPIPTPNQASTAILVEAGDQTLLFDCGRGCGLRLNQYRPDLFIQIDKIFLTHLHSDHVVGLPDILLNGWSMGRTHGLRVWGPVGTSAMMSGLLDAYAADIGYRTEYSSESNPKALDTIVQVLSGDGIVFDEAGLSVTAFRVSHADLPAYGYRIDYNGKSVLISGDTTMSENLLKYGSGVDVSLMEVLSPAMEKTVRDQFNAEKAAAVIALHLTTPQAAKVFESTQPNLAVYYHTVANCQTDPVLISTTREIYSGPLAVARDLMQISLREDGPALNYLGEDATECTVQGQD